MSFNKQVQLLTTFDWYRALAKIAQTDIETESLFSLLYFDIWIPDVLVCLRMGFLNRMQGDKKDNVIKRTGYGRDFNCSCINYNGMKIRIFPSFSQSQRSQKTLCLKFLSYLFGQKAYIQSTTHLSFGFFVVKHPWYLRQKLTDKVDKDEHNPDITFRNFGFLSFKFSSHIPLQKNTAVTISE